MESVRNVIESAPEIKNDLYVFVVTFTRRNNTKSYFITVFVILCTKVNKNKTATTKANCKASNKQTNKQTTSHHHLPSSFIPLREVLKNNNTYPHLQDGENIHWAVYTHSRGNN